MSYPSAKRVNIDVAHFRYMGYCILRGRLRAVQMAAGLAKAMGGRCVVRHARRSRVWIVFREEHALSRSFPDLAGKRGTVRHRTGSLRTRAWRDMFRTMDSRDRRKKRAAALKDGVQS